MSTLSIAEEFPFSTPFSFYEKRAKLRDLHENQGYVKVVTIPVGQGDSTLIQCPGTDGDMTLIDMGADHFALSKDTYIKQVLAHTGVHLKHIFLTHPDLDHISHGLGDDGLIKKIGSSVKVYIGRKVGWDEGAKSSKELINNIKAQAGKITLMYYTKPEDIKICGDHSNIKLRIITSDLGHAPNSRSMVLKLTNGQTSMLFLGDLEDSPAIKDPKTEAIPVIQNLVNLHNNRRSNVNLKADVIMIPHHGSKNNGNGEKNLYEVVGATYAIISSHIKNKHDHPKRKTIESFCHDSGEGIESCDIPCGYNFKGSDYNGQSFPQTMPNGMNAAMCPNADVTTWAPFKTVNPDVFGTTEHGSRNTPFQTWICKGKHVYQTTKFVEDEINGVKVHAYIIGTYLGSGAQQVDHIQAKLIPTADDRFKPPDGTNMFTMI